MVFSDNDVLLERGLLRVTARACDPDESVTRRAYDVEIAGQEILKTFPTFDEARQFLDMVAPAPDDS
ncbi:MULTISPECIES: hypothetical protein [Marinobacter]|uniref:hypothetical protein n=1 Tax=Marinobacter TaxID=2742 RepID=UPI000DAF3C40|nr:MULTISPECIES: hypothetical protein [Marinobacter]